MKDRCTFYRLGRDQAKQLFGCRSADALKAFISGLDPATPLVEAEAAAFVLHRALTDGTLEPDAGEYPLNHAVLGGRILGHEPGFAVIVKRPDMCPHIVAGLLQVTPESIETSFQRLQEADPEQVKETSSSDVAALLTQLVTLYQAASAAGEAVVLVRRSP